MADKRNQVILFEAVHRDLKALAGEAHSTMNRIIESLLQMVEERVGHAIEQWLDTAGKDFIVKASRQPAITIFTALHLLELGQISDQEVKALLVGGDSGILLDELLRKRARRR
jgi:hypothetical protein